MRTSIHKDHCDEFVWLERCTTNIKRMQSEENCSSCLNYSCEGCKAENKHIGDKEYHIYKFSKGYWCLDYEGIK